MDEEEDFTSLQGPVEKVDGRLVLRIPLAAGGDQFIECSRGIAHVDGEYLCIEIPDWLAAQLRVDEGSPVSVDNRDGKCNIRSLNPYPIQ